MSFRLPTKFQLIVAGVLWFILNVAFQMALIHQVTGQCSCIDAFITFALLIIGVFFIYILQKYSPNYFNNIITRIGLTLILVAKTILFERFLVTRLIYIPGYQEVFEQTIVIRIFTAFLVTSFFSFVLWLIFYIRKNDEQVARNLIAENSLRDAELMKLRQQVQPHFLFNSLNSINALVNTEPGQARIMIQNLSDFLRGTLKKDENKPVPLKEEIELLKLYLDIEKVRFGNRLAVSMEVSDEAMTKTIPPLLLQPIVENAIKFGLYNVLEDVEITVDAAYESGLLTITVKNPFDETTSTTRKGEGFGLSLIRRRLQLIYHRADLLKTEKHNNTFITTILIPQHDKGDNN
jgi:LytS/YehU family sensor histidine kinase